MKSGVLLLATQKSIKRQELWKDYLILDIGNRVRGETPMQRPAALQTPHTPLTDNQWAKVFIGWGRGWYAEMAQSPLTVILKEVICGIISVILIVLNTVNLQFQGAGHSRLLEAAYVQLQSGHDAVSFFHMAEVSLSMSQLVGYRSGCYLQPLRRNYKSFAVLNDWTIIWHPLTVFPFILCFLTSLIKLILC